MPKRISLLNILFITLIIFTILNCKKDYNESELVPIFIIGDTNQNIHYKSF